MQVTLISVGHSIIADVQARSVSLVGVLRVCDLLISKRYPRGLSVWSLHVLPVSPRVGTLTKNMQ